MEKPVIATNIDDLLLKHEAFYEPHRAWFEMAIQKTGDESLRKWIGHEKYWDGIDVATKKIFPEASKKERDRWARTHYQEFVIEYINSNPGCIMKAVAEKLQDLKERYRLVLFTTNTGDHIGKILEVSGLSGIYDGIIASKTDEEPNKDNLLQELIESYGRPAYYITGKAEDGINKKFESLGVKVLGVESMGEVV